MGLRHRRDAVAARLGARDPAVSVVGVQRERVGAAAGSRRPAACRWRRCRDGSPRRHVDVGVGAARERANQAVALAAVDAQAVRPASPGRRGLRTSSGSSAAATPSGGRMSRSMTGFYPWPGYQVNDRVSVWGMPLGSAWCRSRGSLRRPGTCRLRRPRPTRCPRGVQRSASAARCRSLTWLLAFSCSLWSPSPLLLGAACGLVPGYVRRFVTCWRVPDRHPDAESPAQLVGAVESSAGVRSGAAMRPAEALASFPRGRPGDRLGCRWREGSSAGKRSWRPSIRAATRLRVPPPILRNVPSILLPSASPSSARR